MQDTLTITVAKRGAVVAVIGLLLCGAALGLAKIDDIFTREEARRNDEAMRDMARREEDFRLCHRRGGEWRPNPRGIGPCVIGAKH